MLITRFRGHHDYYLYCMQLRGNGAGVCLLQDILRLKTEKQL